MKILTMYSLVYTVAEKDTAAVAAISLQLDNCFRDGNQTKMKAMWV